MFGQRSEPKDGSYDSPICPHLPLGIMAVLASYLYLYKKVKQQETST
ncbi:MAG: hypothetical protein KME32_20275 [Mojavia pulchra JT2-VF2]|uniref:Uncharacterized protein n=1 Tax=Mojavia pulchra JT2-VF2 TaxID=287848 RepID=A0A951UIK4_9NOST|nr:hypothetical protein [Mojavia pulchra JT2-VF2]